jgi:dihydroorotate dehydrogenase
VPIIACGGISSPADVRACLDAGATTVQLYTGLIYRGPAIVGELTSGLVAGASDRDATRTAPSARVA